MATHVYTILDDPIQIDGIADGIGAGDIIEIEGNSTAYSQLRFDNIIGTILNPIIIRNAPDRSGVNPDYTKPVKVNNGNDVYFRNDNQHFIMTGDGIPTLDYGFEVVTRIRCQYRMAGAKFYRIKSDTTGNNDVNFFFQERQVGGDPNWIIDGLHIADCDLMAPDNENMYIGPNTASSSPNQWLLDNVLIERNYCHDSAEGIQVSSLVSGAIIRFNRLERIYPADDTAFNSGITLPNGGTKDTQVYGNILIDIGGFGFNTNDSYATNADILRVFNNIFVRCASEVIAPESACIIIQAGSGTHYFYNNTIVGVGDGVEGDGARFTTPNSVNRFENNILIDVEDDYINLTGGASTTDVGNIKQVDDTGLNFADPLNDDYRIQAGSIAIDTQPANTLASTDDYDIVPRTLGLVDAGAFEFVDPRPLNNEFDCGVGSVQFGGTPQYRGNNAGWNSAAIFSQAVGGDYDLTFRVIHNDTDNVCAAMGISASDIDNHWNSIDFGLLFWHKNGEYSRTAAIENGVMTILTEDNLSQGLGGETYHIRKNGSDVELTVGIGPDLIVVHTFTNPAPANIVIDNSAFWSEIYNGFIEFDNIELSF